MLSRPKEKLGLSVSEKELNETARTLEAVLEEFGVNGQIVKVRPGPVVTLFELEPAPGTRTTRVISLADDIARSMAVSSVRIATVNGATTIGIEVPNTKRETVWVRDLLEDVNFTGEKRDNQPASDNASTRPQPSNGDGFMHIPDGIDEELPFK